MSLSDKADSMKSKRTAIDECVKKLDVQREILRGAESMRRSVQNHAHLQVIDARIRDSQSKVDYLLKKLDDLQIQCYEGQKPEYENPNPANFPLDYSYLNSKPLPARKFGDAMPENDSFKSQRSVPSRLDLLRRDAEYSSLKISHMLQQLQFKLSIERKYKRGIAQMIQLYKAGGDKKSMADAQKKHIESVQKEQLLKQAVNKYSDVHVDFDDASIDNTTFQAYGMRKPLTGRLKVSVQAVRNVERTSTSSKPSEIFVVMNIEDNQMGKTRSTRTDRWDETFELDIYKASELEFIVYEKLGDQIVPLAFLWMQISDIAEDVRRRKIEQEIAGSGWISADNLSRGPYNNYNLPSRQDSGSLFLNHNLPKDPMMQQITHPEIRAWFALEPAGEILLQLDFVRTHQRKRATANKLARQNAIKVRKGDVHERYGHQFEQRQFYQIMQCALCYEFILNAAGFQCQECLYLCHKKCYVKVVTKCISKSNSETGPDEELLNHRIPHRFESTTNIAANWCCHCGYILPLGKKHARKCTDCGLMAHDQCTHLIPNFCGISMQTANQILSEIRSTRELQASAAANKKRQENRLPEMPEVNDFRKLDNLQSKPLPQTQPTYTINDLKSQMSQPEHLLPTNQSSQYTHDEPHMSPDKPQQITLPSQQEQQYYVQRTHPEVKQRMKKQPKVGLDDFCFLAVLGKGNFGKVMLAEAKANKKLYAVKVLKKDFILDHDEVESVKSEKRVFFVANKERHPFLINLFACFQTESRIYFVMEYIRGGDLMLHIQRNQFSLRRAQFYAAEVCLALKYFHENGIIYRDLKLDNILLNVDGHIKIADYGLCKEDMWYGKTTTTFCGTPEFMAPEILLEQKYTRAVDWWAFGVLIYQMLLGQSPFRGEDDEEIFEAILSDAPLYPIHMPKDSISILEKLLVRDPERRLGSGSSDALEIMAHPFFRNLDWDDIANKRVTPPFLPTLNGPTDISNFDSEFTQEKPELTPTETILTDAMQDPFRGFTCYCGDD